MAVVVRRTLLALLPVFAVAGVMAPAAGAAAGDLDTTFSGNGKVLTDFAANANDFSGAAGVVIQADGKIVTAGRVGLDGGRFALIRYDTDGTLDTTFGGDGKVATNFTSEDDFATSIALQADGKIVVAGGVGGVSRFGLARYNTDGTLDTTFGGDGKVITRFLNAIPKLRFAVPNAVAIQGDGKIVAAGTVDFDQFALVRYDTDGSLDDAFGGDGRVTTNFSIVSDWASAVIVQTDGKIVAAGTAGSTEFSGTFALARYNADGTLDDTFGGDGKVRTDFNDEQDVAFALAQQTDGKIVAAGGGDASGGRAALARYDTNGSLDSTFSGDGKVRTDFTAGIDAARGVVIQADGKIVTAGTGGYRRFALARYGTDGSLDATFGVGGKVLTDFTRQSGLTVELATGVALQADGKIVAAGLAGVNSGRFALARYLAA